MKSVLLRLSEAIPVAETELVYATPFQLLVAVVLSAQCTDKRINQITPALFEQFPTAERMATADFDGLFPYIRTISYPANKTRNLLGLAKLLVERHLGEVPEDHKALMDLPGVGRKTANVITSVLYNAPRMAVDTHVFRVSARLGLTIGAKTPEKAEVQLMKLLSPGEIPKAHHLLILHGRYTCMARNPSCDSCVLRDLCPHLEKETKRKGKGL